MLSAMAALSVSVWLERAVGESPCGLSSAADSIDMERVVGKATNVSYE